jgi:undecaprenyl-diphosphatase
MAALTPVLLMLVGGIALAQYGLLRWISAARLVLPAVVLGLAAQLTHDAIDGGGITRIDEPVTDWVIDHRIGWLNPVIRTLTDFGGVAAMTALTIVACAWFGVRRHWARLLTTAAVGVGIAVIGSGLKSAIGRHRPPAIDQLVTETSPSFPSGHTMGSTAVVGVLAAMVVLSPCGRMARVAAVAVAALFAVVIGLTRIYLGVHWATDVLAGWSIGLIWLALCLGPYLWWRARVNSRARPAEPEPPAAAPPRRR